MIEKASRQNLPASGLGGVTHIVALLHHLGVFVYAQTVYKRVESVPKHAFDQKVASIADFAPVFFTNWNMAIQTVYFALALAHDVTTHKTIDQLKGFLFVGLVFPCTVYVSGTFWVIYSINRELIFPQVFDEYIPNWLNHCIHTNVLVFLLLEVLLSSQQLPKFRRALAALTLLTAVYDVVFFVTYYVSGRFIYPLFHVLNWPERVIFVIVTYLATVLVMKFGLIIEKYKWSVTNQRAPPVSRKMAID